MNQKKDYVLRWIPKYSIIPLITALVLNTLVYSGTMVLCKGFYHHDFTTAFDRMVPVIPEFTSIYLICYVFWVVNYIMTARISREHMYRFLTADYLSRIVCGIFFVFLPTTLVRPEITGTGFWDQALRFVYSIDQSANLFPSIHCLVSWFCYIGIRHQKKIPVWYQRFSLVFAILVCISTQVTKQHYIIDVFGGIILSEVCYLIGRKMKQRKIFKISYYYIVSGMFVPFAVLMMPLVKETAQLGIANRFGVIVLYVVFFMPMNVLLYSGYLNNIPMALEEAACVDGAGVWQTYWKIIFPNMKPMHATVAVLTAMSTWNDVMTPLVIMSGTDQNTLPLAQLNFQTQFGTNYNLAFASYLLALLPILIFYIICQKQIINGVVNGAVK